VRERPRAARQTAILAAATRAFAAAGYHRTQVARVAREAGVADGTIYLYFRSKQELLVGLFRQGIGAFLDGLEAALAAAPDAAARLGALVAHHLAYLGQRFDLAVVTQVELRQSDPDLRQAIGAIIRPYFDRIERLVGEGCAAGAFDPHLDVKVARRMIFGTLDEQVTAWVRNGGRFDLSALAPEVTRLLGRALRR
jgi:TetR/AcrR family fatty acid metabolism transcriptional regulator